MIIGVIDLGSNSCRMTITDIAADGSCKELANHRELVRLSEGLEADGHLHEAAIGRTIECLKTFHTFELVYGCEVVLPIATAAVRMAKNRAAFLARVKEETGFSFEVIDGKREAYFDYMAIVHSLPVTDCLGIDVGGGSSECMLILGGKLVKAVSIPFGAVLLTEKFAKNEAKLLPFIRKKIAALSFLHRAKGLPVCAMGGSARAMSRMYTQNDTSNLHGMQVPREDFFRIYTEMERVPREARAEIPFMDKARADILYGGVSPVAAAMSLIDAPYMLCCQAGLREGVLFHIKENRA